MITLQLTAHQLSYETDLLIIKLLYIKDPVLCSKKIADYCKLCLRNRVTSNVT